MPLMRATSLKFAVTVSKVPPAGPAESCPGAADAPMRPAPGVASAWAESELMPGVVAASEGPGEGTNERGESVG